MEEIPISVIVVFGVRNYKNRGLLIETLKVPNTNVYFFKHHDQPLARHCEQVQNIVKSANVIRSKKIRIDLSTFMHEYYHTGNGEVMFRATKLNSVNQQIDKAHQMRLNKELGAIKRSVTISTNKQAKIAERNQKIKTKLEEDENKFQAERVRRVNALLASYKTSLGSHGSGQAPQESGQAPKGSQPPNEGGQTPKPSDSDNLMDF